MIDVQKQIRDRIDGFVSELGDLVRQATLETVSAALGGNGVAVAAPALAPAKPVKAAAKAAPAPAAAPKAAVKPAAAKPVVAPKVVAAGKPGAKRPPEEINKLVDALFSHIQSNPGQGVEQIAKSINEETKDLTLPLKKLLSSNMIRTEGQKRATKYYPGAGGAAASDADKKKGGAAPAKPKVKRRKH